MEDVRRAYERGRAKRALVSAMPIAVVAAIAWAMEPELAPIASASALMFVAAVFFFFRGRGLGKGVLPGVAAGIVPFVAMHAARAYGHVCAGSSCFTVCVPAAVIGGLVAGVFVGRLAARSEDQAGRVWASAGVMATLTGSLACACIGVGGLVGLVAGLLVGSIPLAIRPVLRRS
jgi:hypothetical protein